MSKQSPSDLQKRNITNAWRSEIKHSEAFIEIRDFDAALAHASGAACLAEKLGKAAHLRRTARALEVLSKLGLASKLFALAERIEHPEGPPEWDGTSLDGTLLIVARKEHIGALIRWARFIPMAARRVRHCIVLVERRLVPLFARSFPGVDVRAGGPDTTAAQSEAQAMAGFRTLIQHFGFNDEAIYSGFSPLRPDPFCVRAMREKYSPNRQRLAGISWNSTNGIKDIPAISEWGDFMRSFDATYVSLQYGEVAGDVAALRATSGRDVIHDETVDSLLDLDTYAAQVLTTNFVITVSNTCAHMAGALGVRTFLILDDKLRLSWPVESTHTPWYPTMTTIRMQGRNWGETFKEVRSRAYQFAEQGSGAH